MLGERALSTRPFFLGMRGQLALRARGLFADECYQHAERFARRRLCLPSDLTLTEAQHETVCDVVEEALAV